MRRFDQEGEEEAAADLSGYRSALPMLSFNFLLWSARQQGATALPLISLPPFLPQSCCPPAPQV